MPITGGISAKGNGINPQAPDKVEAIEILKKNQIDGWYGKVTYNAVKKYQAKYAKKYDKPY